MPKNNRKENLGSTWQSLSSLLMQSQTPQPRSNTQASASLCPIEQAALPPQVRSWHLSLEKVFLPSEWVPWASTICSTLRFLPGQFCFPGQFHLGNITLEISGNARHAFLPILFPQTVTHCSGNWVSGLVFSELKFYEEDFMVTGLFGGGSWIFSQGTKGSPRWLGRERKKRNQWSGSWGLEGADNSEKNTHKPLLLGDAAHVFFSQFYQSWNWNTAQRFPRWRSVQLNASYSWNVQLVIIAMPSVEMSACVSKKLVGSRKHLSLVMRFSKTVDSQTLGTRMAGDYASPVPVSNPTWWPLPLHPSPRVPTLHLPSLPHLPKPQEGWHVCLFAYWT